MTLEQLTGRDWGDPADAPTDMVATLTKAGKKPLEQLDGYDIRMLLSQGMGIPFVVDLAWLFIERDPLTAFDLFEGDVLSALIKAPDKYLTRRPEYQEKLEGLKARALAAPAEISDSFRESLEQP